MYSEWVNNQHCYMCVCDMTQIDMSQNELRNWTHSPL